MSKYHGLGHIVYILGQLKKNITNWKWLKFSFGRAMHILYYKFKRNKGIHVADEEWDNLIILDASRHDIFEKAIGKPVPHKISRGSATVEFLLKNFKGKKFDDIVYVTANPYVDILTKDSFFKTVPAWKISWNDEHQTVMPSDIIKHALIAKRAYPKKRVIIHFIQPHHPFVRHPELYQEDKDDRAIKTERGDPWKRVMFDKLDIKKVWDAYVDNLDYVLPYALRLAEKLEGKTVITSDHGNFYKECKFPFKYKLAGHPGGIHTEELVKVPWMVFEKKKD